MVKLTDLVRVLREERMRLGLNQSEVAEKMGTTQGHVSQIESGLDVRMNTLSRYNEVITGRPLELKFQKRELDSADSVE